ncbi:MAG: MBL fold metallo-hydrolase [Rhodocyclales bacterium]|nr:MBL fold metallo-hydrolase [Rhodocyclales bacterium]
MTDIKELASRAGRSASKDGTSVQSTTERDARIILLGTKGGPRIVSEGRKNPSTLLLLGGVPYVVDCGYGTSMQLQRAGVPPNMLRYIFITHHHSDHNIDLGPLIYNAWAAGLKTPVEAYGPPPIKEIAKAFLDYAAYDVDIRVKDEGRVDLRELVVAHEFDRPGLVMQNDQVRVTATRVRHPPIHHSYAFRFDTREGSVVVSGDTTYSPELIELAMGADVLVHEALYLPGLQQLLQRVPNAATMREHQLASHTATEDVGRVAVAAGVKTLVLSHFVPGDDPSITDDEWTEGIRKHFSGRIIVGKDLMVIPVRSQRLGRGMPSHARCRGEATLLP